MNLISLHTINSKGRCISWQTTKTKTTTKTTNLETVIQKITKMHLKTTT